MSRGDHGIPSRNCLDTCPNLTPSSWPRGCSPPSDVCVPRARGLLSDQWIPGYHGPSALAQLWPQAGEIIEIHLVCLNGVADSLPERTHRQEADLSRGANKPSSGEEFYAEHLLLSRDLLLPEGTHHVPVTHASLRADEGKAALQDTFGKGFPLHA